jgi:hypothetical protein
MRRSSRGVLFILLLVVLGSVPARAGKIALLLEEPYGRFGAMNPTGHAAIYLSDVCAETPVHLRRCDPGERGVVISRYHKVGGYDWIAMPLLAYLYAVNNPDQIPLEADRKLATQLRDAYRRKYLMDIVPDSPHHTVPKGNWTELVGEAYDRKIYGFALETTPQQDDALIAGLNDHKNHSHFNLFFNNCANFAEELLNFYYPHSIHRNFIEDVGLMTPKQAAHSMEKYARRNSDLELTTFVIPQIPGTIHRSTPVHGVIEALLETKKYSVPLAFLHPAIAGGLIAVYVVDGRFHPAAHMETVFNPRKDAEPGMITTAKAEPLKNQEKAEPARDVSYQYPNRYPGSEDSSAHTERPLQ